MTSREKTGLLSAVEKGPERPLGEKLFTVAFGAIQWPWLARSLWGGRLKDKHALLDRLGLDRVRWVGHDWGAYVGMLAGLREPERVERLVAMSIPHPWRKRPPDPATLLTAIYQPLLASPLGQVAVRTLNFGHVILTQGRSVGSFSDEELDAYDAVEREADAAEATVRIYRTFLLHEAFPWANGAFKAGRLTVPTLWLVGERDPLASVSDDGYRDYADDMTLEFVPKANHFMPEEIPDVLCERVLAFL